MKVSTAALSFLLLAAALGSQAQVIQDTEIIELQRMVDLPEPPIFHSVLAHAPDCCFSYTPRKIRCTFMEDYFETSSGCSQPGVIFVTKKGRQICGDPRNSSVQNCMKKLKPNSKN